MEPYPTVGDIWEWDNSGRPLLLLELTDLEREEIIFYCLDLLSNERYHMGFAPSIHSHWRILG